MLPAFKRASSFVCFSHYLISGFPVYREYAYNKEVLKKIEAKIASFKTSLDPVPAEDLVAAERRQQDTSTIIAFKGQALDLLMTAVMIEDKEFLCRIGTVPPVSTIAELPAYFRIFACY